MPTEVDRTSGRYVVFGELASGGMATVHLGCLLGAAGFSRTVAIKRLHAHLAKDPDFVTMLQEEARLAAHIQHANVVAMLDIVDHQKELFLVMEYVHGESLSRLFRLAKSPPSVPVAITIITGVLRGLHAAHEATNSEGHPLELVHRDVSPQNVMVGVDGVARLLDFGVAKAAGRAQATRDGAIKGKLSYMAPEQLGTGKATRQTDVYAASIVLWELLTGTRLFDGETEGEIVGKVLEAAFVPMRTHVPDLPQALDEIVARGLARDRTKRFATAADMADALEAAHQGATAAEVGKWVTSLAGDSLSARAKDLRTVDRVSAGATPALGTLILPAIGDLTTPSASRARHRSRKPLFIASAAAAFLISLVTLGALARSRLASAPTMLPESSAVAASIPSPMPPASPSADVPVASASTPAPLDSATPAVKTRATPAHVVKPKTTTKPADCYEIGPDGQTRLRRACMR